jgi:hypothetical protein
MSIDRPDSGFPAGNPPRIRNLLPTPHVATSNRGRRSAAIAAPDGRIFALTSGRTFSAGIASLGYLKQAGGARVTIVGEPVGDELEFWAEGDMLELPVSKAALLYATERHNYVTGRQEPDCHGSVRNHPIRVTTLEPDMAAPLTYADYRAGRDPALASACVSSE